MITRTSQTHVTPSTLTNVTYKRREAFGGIIKWYEKVSVEKLAHEIHITADQTIDRVYLNGVEFKSGSQE